MSTAVITGGAGGIGRAIAGELLRRSRSGPRQHQIVIVDIDTDGLTRAKLDLDEEFGTDAVLEWRNDVSSSDDVQRVATEIAARSGPIDVLVNNAAITDRVGRIEELSDDDWESELAVNLSSTFFWTRAVFGGMRDRGWGRVVNVSSVAGTLGNFGHAPYAASKAGMLGLTKTAALEGAPDGVTVNAVAPGLIHTPAYDRIPENLRKRTEATSAMRRPGRAGEVASMIGFLASDASSYVTGEVITVGGGTGLFVL